MNFQQSKERVQCIWTFSLLWLYIWQKRKILISILNNTSDKKVKIKSHNVTIYLCQAVLKLAMDQRFNPFTVAAEERETPQGCGSNSQWRIYKNKFQMRVLQPPPPAQFFHFHAVFRKIWPNNRLVVTSSGKSWIHRRVIATLVHLASSIKYNFQFYVLRLNHSPVPHSKM